VKPEQAKVSVYFNVDNGQRKKFAAVHSAGKRSPSRPSSKLDETLQRSGHDHAHHAPTPAAPTISPSTPSHPGFQFIQDPIDTKPAPITRTWMSTTALQPDDLKQISVIVARLRLRRRQRDQMLPRKPIEKSTAPRSGEKRRIIQTMNNEESSFDEFDLTDRHIAVLTRTPATLDAMLRGLPDTLGAPRRRQRYLERVRHRRPSDPSGSAPTGCPRLRIILGERRSPAVRSLTASRSCRKPGKSLDRLLDDFSTPPQRKI